MLGQRGWVIEYTSRSFLPINGQPVWVESGYAVRDGTLEEVLDIVNQNRETIRRTNCTYRVARYHETGVSAIIIVP